MQEIYRNIRVFFIIDYKRRKLLHGYCVLSSVLIQTEIDFRPI